MSHRLTHTEKDSMFQSKEEGTREIYCPLSQSPTHFCTFNFKFKPKTLPNTDNVSLIMCPALRQQINSRKFESSNVDAKQSNNRLKRHKIADEVACEKREEREEKNSISARTNTEYFIKMNSGCFRICCDDAMACMLLSHFRSLPYIVAHTNQIMLE